MRVYLLLTTLMMTLTNTILASQVVIYPRKTTILPVTFHPLAIKEMQNGHLPWDQYLPEDSIQKSKFFEEEVPQFRTGAIDEEGTFVVGPPRRLVKGKNDTYRMTPIVPLKENYMNCSFRKKNPVAYDEALYPFEHIDREAGKTVLVVCDNSAHGSNMCNFLKSLYSADSSHCTCPHVMDGYANVGFCTLKFRDGKEMSYCNTPAHKPMWLLRLCAYKIPVPMG